MDLWIRSQDRKYLISDSQLGYHEKNGQHSILAYIRDEYRVIGTYKTEKRALEVLDEIQDLFITKEALTTEFTKDGLTIMNKQPSSVVYEMPEE